MLKVVTERDCRILYADILQGYSLFPSQNIILKHYTELDLCQTERVRLRFHAKAIREGELTEKDKLVLLSEKGHWTVSEEKEYQDARSEIEGMYHSLKPLVIPQQIEHLKGLIAEKEKEFYSKFSSRAELLGTTAEAYASRRASESHIIRSLFKNEEMTIPYLTEEQIDDLDAKQLGIFINIYHDVHQVYTEKTFKKIAVCPFFINGYTLSGESAHAFFGRPVSQLTLYQSSLFSRGRYFKNILDDPESQRPPEEFYEDLDKVILHYDRQYSIMLGRRTKNQLVT